MQQIYEFAQIGKKAEDVLSKAFPRSAVSVDEGWHGRVHIKIVSNSFNGRSEEQKQEAVWGILKSELGDEAQAVSLVLVYGLDEL